MKRAKYIDSMRKGIASLALIMAVIIGPHAEQPQPTPPASLNATPLEFSVGHPEAPLVIVMYYSLSCPHCHEFQEKVLPQILEKYTTTDANEQNPEKKQVRFVYRDFPTDGLALQATKIAWARGTDYYLPIAKNLLKTQDIWATQLSETLSPSEVPNPQDKLCEIAANCGIRQEECQQCLANKDLEDHIIRTSFEAQKNYQILGAPTFLINGKIYEGELTIETVEDMLNKKDFLQSKPEK